MPVRYLIALAGAAVLMAFVMGYEKGAEKVKRDMAIQTAAQAEDARQKEKDMQKKLNGITENYLHEIDEYKKTINAYAANDLEPAMESYGYYLTIKHQGKKTEIRRGAE